MNNEHTATSGKKAAPRINYFLNDETNNISLVSPYMELFESEKNWAWHDSGDGHIHLTQKVLLLLKLSGASHN